MGASRENADLFWWVKRWGVRKMVNRKIWKNRYFLHDTFGVRFNRLIGCRFGHRKVDTIESEVTGKYDVRYCFACKRKIDQ